MEENFQDVGEHRWDLIKMPHGLKDLRQILYTCFMEGN